jgi:HK97 gp10 family phage protein
MVEIGSNLTGDLSGALDKFEKSIQEKVLFSGVAAMAKVIYEQAVENCPESAEAHIFRGSSYAKHGTEYLFYPGDLKKSIYRVYSPEKSTQELKTYRISWNKKIPYGYWVEFGNSRMPAHPFIRPAFDRVDDAIEAGKARMGERMVEIASET